MEVIRKKICLETAKSRKQGLLAYIGSEFNTRVESGVVYGKKCDFLTDKTEYEISYITPGVSDFIFVEIDNPDGNYSGYVCNPYFSGGTGAELFGVGYSCYMDIIYHYNKLHNMLMDGIKLKKIIKHGDIYYIDDFDDKLSIYDHKIVDASSIISINDNLYKVDNDTVTYKTITYIDNCGNEKTKTISQRKDGSTDIGDFVNGVYDYDYFVTLCSFFGGIKNVYVFLKFVEENFIGKLEVPKEITGDSVPEFIYYCDIVEYYDWFVKHDGDSNCCIIKEWNKRGGNKMYDFLRNHLYVYETAIKNAKEFFVEDESGEQKHVPKINLEVLFPSRMSEVGILNSYVDEEDYLNGIYRYGIDKETKIATGTANSRLNELMVPFVGFDDNGEKLPGMFVKNKYMIYRSQTIGSRKEWERVDNISYEKLSKESLKGTISNLTVPPQFLCNPSYGKSTYPNNETGYCDDYYIISKYSNHITIPYKTALDGYVYNEHLVRYYDSNGNEFVRVEKFKQHGEDVYYYEMVGDYITKITIDGNRIRFEYTFGGHYWAEKRIASGTSVTYYAYVMDTDEPNGVKYSEEYNYFPGIETPNEYMFKSPDKPSGVCEYVDGEIEPRTLVYDFIDFDSAKIRIKHEELGLERDGLIANIVDYRAADPFAIGRFSISAVSINDIAQVNEDGASIILDISKIIILNGYNRESIKTPIYKEESLNRISTDADVKVDISVSRGNAASCDVHFKICECDSLEDLENYGNNYFNL